MCPPLLFLYPPLSSEEFLLLTCEGAAAVPEGRASVRGVNTPSELLMVFVDIPAAPVGIQLKIYVHQ